MSSTFSLAEIEARVFETARRIHAPPGALPGFGVSEQSGRPHIEVDTGGYHYIVAERGIELERHTYSEIEDLFRKVFADVTFALAVDYELAHRLEDQDCRRIIFRRQVELLAQLSPEWARLEQQEHQRILELHPFDDLAGMRASLCAALCQRGHTQAEAESIALEKYPLPAGVTWR